MVILVAIFFKAAIDICVRIYRKKCGNRIVNVLHRVTSIKWVFL